MGNIAGNTCRGQFFRGAYTVVTIHKQVAAAGNKIRVYTQHSLFGGIALCNDGHSIELLSHILRGGAIDCGHTNQLISEPQTNQQIGGALVVRHHALRLCRVFCGNGGPCCAVR